MTRRGKQKKKVVIPKTVPASLLEGWFEITEAFDPARAQLLDIQHTYGHRMFVRGHVGKLLIVEVPEETPEEVQGAVGAAISQGGISALVVTERYRFWKLRRASQAESEEIERGIKEEEAAEPERLDRDDAPEDPGAGPVAQCDGPRGDGHGDDEARAQRVHPLEGSESSDAHPRAD